jgi:hypothetical protein
MASAPVPEVLHPEWFFPLFILMWLGITGLLSYIGGWASLASSFPAHDEVRGESFRFRSGSLGRRYFPVRYGNCLFITVNQEGFGISILFPFRFLSPPIFVPWAEVVAVEEKRYFYFLSYYVVGIRDHWSRISVRGTPGRSLKEQFDAYHASGRSNKSLEHTRGK